MPLTYTANELVAMSAVIARAATSRNWTSAVVNDDGDPVQEVQCMIMKDKLYIAGNHAEHKSVDAYLKAFGVRDEASLRECLRYSFWLLNMRGDLRSATTSKAYRPKFSEQEKNALSLAPADPFGTVSVPEATAAKALITGTNAAPNDVEKRLGWFLRKFVGAAMDARYPKATNADIAGITNSIQEPVINIINSIEPIHAEIKLLAFLTQCLVTFKMVGQRSVTLGGLKKACKYCDKWMTHYQEWLRLQYKFTLVLPTNDDRADGGGAGKRPQNPATDVFGDVMKLLFNGLDNDLCADVAAKRTTEGW